MESPSDNHLNSARSKVIIHGLRNAAQHNFKVGVIEAYDSDDGRFNVCLWTSRPQQRQQAKRILRVKPANLWLFPGPVKDADRGDDAFEAVQAFMELTLKVGDDGDLAKEVDLLAAFCEDDRTQPGFMITLWRRYSLPGRSLYNKDKAFEYLHKAVTELNKEIYLAEPSDPQSVDAFPPVPPGDRQRLSTVIEMVQLLATKAFNFVEENFVVGLMGDALKPTLDVMRGIMKIVENAAEGNPDLLSPELLASNYFVLGNVCRKMSANEMALEYLLKADEEMKKIGQRHPGALLMIPDVKFTHAYLEETDEEKKKLLFTSALEDAEETLRILEGTERYSLAQVLLASLRCNLLRMGRCRFSSRTDLENFIEGTSVLAKDGLAGVTELEDDYAIRRAQHAIGFLEDAQDPQNLQQLFP